MRSSQVGRLTSDCLKLSPSSGLESGIRLEENVEYYYNALSKCIIRCYKDNFDNLQQANLQAFYYNQVATSLHTPGLKYICSRSKRRKDDLLHRLASSSGETMIVWQIKGGS